MTQEDKQLSLKDLCGRLPYGVIGLYTWKNKRSYDKELTGNLYDELESSWNSIAEDSQFLPYLRPMSSMTEAEKEYYYTFIDEFSIDNRYPQFTAKYVNKKLVDEYIDWLNAHYFDYRGLIPRGLALKAPEGMYREIIKKLAHHLLEYI